MFKKPFSFKGRIRRLEFGLSYLIYLILVYGFEFGIDENSDLVILGFLAIPLLWFVLAQGAKRCHDRGNSGWYILIPFYLLWMLFAESDYGENEYGLNPKGEGNQKEIEQIGISQE